MPDASVLASARSARLVHSLAVLELVGHSAAIRRLQELVRRAARTDTGVLIVAEQGCEAEPVARALHARGRHAAAAFVRVDCAEDVAPLERRLFGSAPDGPRDLEAVVPDSRIAAARGGTLFLDHVADLPASLQTRLARIARDGEVRVDGVVVATDFRLVGRARPGLESDVQAHRFRDDLYRRLGVTRLDLPPLRDRAEDVPTLAMRLLDEIAEASGGSSRAFTQAALGLLAAVTWRGNLTELRSVIERVVSETDESSIQIEHLLPALRLDRAPAPFVPAGNLREARRRFEREYIAAVLAHHGWQLTEAAQTLGIQRPNLYRKARQLGITLGRTSD